MSLEEETENTPQLKPQAGGTSPLRHSPATAGEATQLAPEVTPATEVVKDAAPPPPPPPPPSIDVTPSRQKSAQASPEEQLDKITLVQALTQPLADVLSKREKGLDLLSKLKGWRGYRHPFATWQEAGVMGPDFELEKECVDLLEKAARTVPGAEKDIQVLCLAAKNRAEELSDKADFYPASGPLLTTLFLGTLAVVITEPTGKWVFGMLTFAILSLFLSVRLNTRRQVAQMKVIANLLDLVEKRLR